MPVSRTVSAINLGPHDPTVEHADVVSQGNDYCDGLYCGRWVMLTIPNAAPGRAVQPPVSIRFGLLEVHPLPLPLRSVRHPNPE